MVAESLAARFGKIAAILLGFLGGLLSAVCGLLPVTSDQNRISVTSNASWWKKFLRFVWFCDFRGSLLRKPKKAIHQNHGLHEVHESAKCYFKTYFLKSFANASRASEGGPDEVWRSTTIRVANSSQVLRACLSTIRAAIFLLHSKRAPGSK
jgi:hypothetical protein